MQIGWHMESWDYFLNYHFSTRRTRILMGFMASIYYYLVLIVNIMGTILARLVPNQSFRKNLKIPVPPYVHSAVPPVCIF